MAAVRPALNRAAAGALLLLIGGCSLLRIPSTAPAAATSAPVASPAPAPAAAATAPPAGTEPRPPAAPPPRSWQLGAATQSLVTQARAQVARGDTVAASITLDRAVRIEPGNPLVWIELARQRLAAGEPRPAEGLARKALSLAGADPGARTQAQHALADALRAQGRNGELRDSESRTTP